MKLYNSATRKIEDFVPFNKNELKLYTCGPTVYHYAHIGNLRTYIFEDILEKSLSYLGYNVNRVMNITDVGHLTSDEDTGEDKMLKGAKRENKSVLDIAKFYTEAFKRDFESLKLKWPSVVIPATNCVNTYIEMIEVLLKKGYAYISGDNIYFDTSKIEEYNPFNNQQKEDFKVGVRDTVDEDKHKKNQQDFVLWFTKSKFENQELKWNSPWGVGYPGWHIECSGISYKYLGDYLDIHCGGVDNKFPHHANEIAQSEAFFGKKWCRSWFHVEHLNIMNGKMSKSEGNFLTMPSLKEKGYTPEVYKLFCLQSHYRKVQNFSFESLDIAKATYSSIIKKISALSLNDEKIDHEKVKLFDEQFKEALSNDLNTSLAVTAIFDVLKSDLNDNSKMELIKRFDNVLSVSLSEALKKEQTSSIQDNQELLNIIKEKVALRDQAKKNKDYSLADKIRGELEEIKVSLVDSSNGVIVYHDGLKINI